MSTTDKTKVIFRKFRGKGGEVIALFPEEPGTYDPQTCMSYVHHGQHGPADVRIVSKTKPATEAEAAPLKAELERIGYNLDVRKAVTRRMNETRRAALL